MKLRQVILSSDNNYESLVDYIQRNGLKKIFIICGSSFQKFRLKGVLDELNAQGKIQPIYFSEFQPNPDYESVVKGVDAFRKGNCDSIFAIGGGSAMDVAKCVKLYSNMPEGANYLQEPIVPNDIPFLAAPTTAGTGSEATRYAVIYYKGEKQSVTDYSCIPQAVLFDASMLAYLPEYQRKATMLDAFCHSVESFWSVNSTDESKEYSKAAIGLILEYIDSYLENAEPGNSAMLKAANLAGQAINITQTTAGHAMCYKMTKLYDISHGHAAALCVSVLWRFMVENTSLSMDSRGKDYLDKMFLDLASAMGCVDAISAVERFQRIVSDLNLRTPVVDDESDFELLARSVNLVRLKNNPVRLDEQTINVLYRKIFDEK
ncbi:MAG: phosphonoacetaldehyde reductase [Paludibacteraceae bacterium]|nr:phosphonoacetaldehyde reductase [Paludibacteraceae bacterium]